MYTILRGIETEIEIEVHKNAFNQLEIYTNAL